MLHFFKTGNQKSTDVCKAAVIFCLAFSAFFPSHAQNYQLFTATKIYTMDTAFTVAQALLIKDNRIVYCGTLDSANKILAFAKTRYTQIETKSTYIYPGFIDAHCHFMAYCRGLKQADLLFAKSEKDAIKRVKKYAKKNKHSWIVGRGWDQNIWKNNAYPSLTALDKAFPNTPVYLSRIDGHAAWINSAAIRILKLNTDTLVEGGIFMKENGRFTGILIDNAVDLVKNRIPDMPFSELKAGLDQGLKLCHANGLTGLDEAGLPPSDIEIIESLQSQGQLPIRIYAMLENTPEGFGFIYNRDRIKTDWLNVQCMKFYLDGALGSRGALLKAPYCDQPGYRGLQLMGSMDLLGKCALLYNRGYQVAVHAIGDSANAIVLRSFRQILPPAIDMRWRVEHAQIVDTNDLKLFNRRAIIPSVQPTHATSDALWAPGRLCKSRMAGAYAYKSMLKYSGMIALGTDFPVEDISPLKTFYSATLRMDMAGKLKSPFLPDQALTPMQALAGMTIWAAYANNEEAEKGSLEPGKLADFVVLNCDLLTATPKQLKKAKVFATYIDGIQRIKK